MGNRGPQKTPKEINKLHGNPGRHKETNVISTPDGEVSCPDWLMNTARDVWEYYAPQLDSVGLLKPYYTLSFAMFCAAYAEFIDSYKLVQEKGVEYTTVQGNVVQRPAVGAKNKASERANRLGQQFGFSPSTWASMNIPDIPIRPKDGEINNIMDLMQSRGNSN